MLSCLHFSPLNLSFVGHRLFSVSFCKALCSSLPTFLYCWLDICLCNGFQSYRYLVTKGFKGGIDMVCYSLCLGNHAVQSSMLLSILQYLLNTVDWFPFSDCALSMTAKPWRLVLKP